MLFSAHVLGVQIVVRWLGSGASTSLAQYIICTYLGNFALCYVVFVDVFCTCFSLNDLYLVCCLCTYIFVWFIVYWTDLLVLLLLFGYRAYASCCVFLQWKHFNISNISFHKGELNRKLIMAWCRKKTKSLLVSKLYTGPDLRRHKASQGLIGKSYASLLILPARRLIAS